MKRFYWWYRLRASWLYVISFGAAFGGVLGALVSFIHFNVQNVFFDGRSLVGFNPPGVVWTVGFLSAFIILLAIYFFVYRPRLIAMERAGDEWMKERNRRVPIFW